MKMVSPKSKKKSPGDLKVQAIVQKAEIMARRLADSVLGVALKDPWKWGARPGKVQDMRTSE